MASRTKRACLRCQPLALESLEGRTLLSTYTVDSLGDTGTGSGSSGDLRYAITQANLSPGSTIQFSVTGTIQLGCSLPSLSQNITITGPGESSLTINGGGSSSNYNAFTVDSGVTATISGLTVANFYLTGDGGGIINDGTLTLTNDTISGNSASGGGGGLANSGTLMVSNSAFSSNSGGDGGGIVNYATATVSGSIFNSNSASYGDGGGLLNYGSATVSGSSFAGNSATSGEGGGLSNYATVTVSGCTYSNNSASDGGGIVNYTTATVSGSAFTSNSVSYGSGGGLLNDGLATVSGSSFAGNSASDGGGLSNYETVTISGSSFAGNSASAGNGGGLSNHGMATVNCSTFAGNSASSADGGGLSNYGTVTVSGSTFAGNSASAGGGSVNYGTATVTGSTFAGNSADYGGGIANESDATATLTNCTLSRNSSQDAGGVANASGGSLTLNNTIVAGNSSAVTTDNDIYGQVQPTSALNLIGDGSGISNFTDLENPAMSNLVGTMVHPINPLLAPLADYGGPTQTMALLPGSLAIDSGNNALFPPAVTSRSARAGPGRQRRRGHRRFESSGFTIAVTSGNDQSTIVSTPFPAPLVATVTANNPIEPVAGGQVIFTPPQSGASATLSGSPATIGADSTVSVTAVANAVGGNYTVSAGARGIWNTAIFSLTNMWVPTFSDLTSSTIVYGTSTTTITGSLGDGTAYPTGSTVTITIGSDTETPTVDNNGDFTTTFSTANLGVTDSPYTVTYSFPGNPTFTPASDTSTTLTVTAAPLTASIVGDPTKTYDGTTSAALTQANFSLSGLVGSQSFTVTQTVGTYNSEDVTVATMVTASLTPSDFTPGPGTVASNYILPTTACGAGNINSALLTVTASNESMTYGGSVPALAYTYTGLVNGNTSASFSGGLATTATSSSNVGSYSITQGNLAATGNYTIGTFIPGTLTVTMATNWVDHRPRPVGERCTHPLG